MLPWMLSPTVALPAPGSPPFRHDIALCTVSPCCVGRNGPAPGPLRDHRTIGSPVCEWLCAGPMVTAQV